MAFSAVGIRVRPFVSALLALVSGYQCISQFLVSCCAPAASNWIFLQVGYPVGSPTNSALKQTPLTALGQHVMVPTNNTRPFDGTH